ncbi:aryl-alcohol dehydrogenase [NADP(+)] [Aspergillus crustosus]
MPEENFFLSRPQAPKTSLGYYRALAKSASIHASPIALGGMNLGNNWAAIGINGTSDEDAFKLLNAYFDNGGNFIDVANHYQSGHSETLLGQWSTSRNIRDQLIIATKYSQADHKAADPTVKQRVNYLGNSKKSLHIAIAESLARLQTTYVDIYYVHWWDYETSIEEVMNSLHDLVTSGKVLYLGASNMPAWVVARANQYAIDLGKTPFSIYSGCWNVMERSFEADIIPMARDFDMALAPWEVLCGGRLRSDAEEERRRVAGEKGRDTKGVGWERSEEEKAVSRALEKVAGEVGASSLGAVAIAYLYHKYHRVFPVVGGRKVEHLLSNVEAIDIKLTPEQIEYIESVKPWSPGMPHVMLGDGTKNNILVDINTHVDRLPPRGIIVPRGLKKAE